MILNLPGPSAYDSDFDVGKVLEQFDAFIVALAHKKVPRNVVPSAILNDEIEELAQKVRIKLWKALQKKPIINLRAYISCIVYTEVIDMVRHYRSTFPLSLDEDGELSKGKVIVTPGEGMQDPAFEVEQEESLADYTKETAEAVLKLPPRQQLAMICSLKDQLDDVLPIIDILRNHAVDIEEATWPEEKDELQSLRASLSIARKKLRSLKN